MTEALHPVFDDEPEWLAPIDRDRTEPMTWLRAAWDYEAKASALKAELKRVEEARDECLAIARTEGITETDIGHGVIRLVVTPGTRTRVLDVEAFKAHYPKEFKRAATYTVKLADAERVLGTTLLGELCTYREGAERLKLEFTPTYTPAPFVEATRP